MIVALRRERHARRQEVACSGVERTGSKFLQKRFATFIGECLAGKGKGRGDRQGKTATVGDGSQTTDINWTSDASGALQHVDDL